MNSYDSAFYQILAARIKQMIVDRCMDLGTGGICKESDVPATAMGYSRSVGYLAALHDVGKVCEEVQKEMLKTG